MANENTPNTAPNPDNSENIAEELDALNESGQPIGEDALPEDDQFVQPEMSREQRVIRKFYGCVHILNHRKRSHMAHGQGRLLAILIRTGKVSQRDLQDMTGIRSASLSELLKKLEANGFISREQNAEDRRSVDISLTEVGTAEAERLRAERDASRDLFSSLSEEELEQLENLLEKLLKAWDPEGEFSPHNPDRACRRGHGRGHGHGHGRGHGHGPGRGCGHGGPHGHHGPRDCEGHGPDGRRKGHDPEGGESPDQR